MKKRILSALLAVCLLGVLLSACATSKPAELNPNGAGNQPATNTDPVEVPRELEVIAPEDFVADTSKYAAEGIDENGRFIETRKISVEVFDRGLDDEKTKPEDNAWSKWIEEGVKRDLNIEIEWVTVPRFADGGEETHIVTLMAAGTAPDVCVTYNEPAIQEYANMGGIIDMAPYINDYRDLTVNLWNLLGQTNLHWSRNPDTGTIWCIQALLANNSRINTFVREDWLAKLGLSEPTNIDEFEAMLIAFRDNADLLLGAEANRLIPFSLGEDVGWRANNLLVSFVPDAMTDKDAFVYGFDDRQFLYPGYKEGVRVLNKWFNDKLIWQDFSILGVQGNTTEDDNAKAGIVGAMIHNWDYPYRNGEDSIQMQAKSNRGEDAAFIAVDAFKNDAGVHRKFLSNSVDRKVFFSANNKEPLASIMYVDWISRPDVIRYLQIGDEGVVHNVLDDGTIEIISAKGTPWIQNSLYNIDYTTTINGLDFGDPDATGKALGLSMAPIDPYYVGKAYGVAQNDKRIIPHFNVGEILSESGMSNALKDKRNALLGTAINAPVDQFDAIWDSGYQDYLNSGGQAIIDERKAAYEKYIDE